MKTTKTTKSTKSTSTAKKATARSRNTLREIPTAKANAKQIVALVKTSGKVTGYKLSDGKTVNKQAAVQMARQGGISGVGISVRSGTEYLKTIPDGRTKNLGNLPTVKN